MTRKVFHLAWRGCIIVMVVPPLRLLLPGLLTTAIIGSSRVQARDRSTPVARRGGGRSWSPPGRSGGRRIHLRAAPRFATLLVSTAGASACLPVGILLADDQLCHGLPGLFPFRFPTLDLKTQQLGPPRTLFLVDLLPDRFVASHHREGRRRKRGKHQGGHATAYNSHKHGNSHRVARRELKL